jgi:hypothetical protein
MRRVGKDPSQRLQAVGPGTWSGVYDSICIAADFAAPNACVVCDFSEPCGAIAAPYR